MTKLEQMQNLAREECKAARRLWYSGGEDNDTSTVGAKCGYGWEVSLREKRALPDVSACDLSMDTTTGFMQRTLFGARGATKRTKPC